MEHYHLEGLVNSFEACLAADTKTSKEVSRKRGSYHYIPLSLEKFHSQVTDALTTHTLRHGTRALSHTLKFIDVGCGVGTKVLYANDVFRLLSHGIEYNPRYVAQAKRLLKSNRPPNGERAFEIILGDALTHNYRPYDLIYFYCPLSAPNLQTKLEKRILKTAKAGALILTNLRQGGDGVWKGGRAKHAINDIFEIR